jgi:hypothetical protein
MPDLHPDLAGRQNSSYRLEFRDDPANRASQAGPRRSCSALAYGSRSTAAAANNPHTEPDHQADC